MLNSLTTLQQDGTEPLRLYSHGNNIQQQLMYGLWVVYSLKWLEGSLSCQHKIVQSRWKWLSTWQEVQMHHWLTKFKTLTIKPLWNNFQHSLEKTSKIFLACVRIHRLSIFAKECLNLIQNRGLRSSRLSNILTWLNSIKRTMNH